MAPSPTFTGVVLAGGASRRMGRDKACLLTPSGSSMLTMMEEILRMAGAHKALVLGRGDLPNGLPDKVPGKGPADAVIHYLSGQKPGSKHVFVPVDMPNLTPSLLANLAKENRWACYGDFHLPFLAVASEAGSRPAKRLGSLLQQHKPKRLSIPGFEPFVNLNTPHQFHMWKTEYGESHNYRIAKHV